MASEKPAYPTAATSGVASRSALRCSAPQSVSAPSPYAVQPAIAPRGTTAPRPPTGGRDSRVAGRSPAAASSRASSGRAAQAVTSRPAQPTESRCGPGAAAVAASPPTRPPPSPPKLSAACRDGIIGRSQPACSCTPRVFTATLITPVTAPNMSSAAPSSGTEDANPGSATVAHMSTEATVVTRPGPSRSQSAPVRRMVASAPRDTHSSAAPRDVGVAPRRSLTSGTRTAQLPNTTPSSANSAVTARRALGTAQRGVEVGDQRVRPRVSRASAAGEVWGDLSMRARPLKRGRSVAAGRRVHGDAGRARAALHEVLHRTEVTRGQEVVGAAGPQASAGYEE